MRLGLVGAERRLPAYLVDINAIPVAHEHVPDAYAGHDLQPDNHGDASADLSAVQQKARVWVLATAAKGQGWFVSSRRYSLRPMLEHNCLIRLVNCEG